MTPDSFAANPRDPRSVKPGDELYVHSAGYIDHGEDDRCGGIAVVERVIHKPIPQNPINDWMVNFVGLDSSFNLQILLREQDKLAKEYGRRISHQCPEGQRCPNPRKPKEAEVTHGAD